jgi:dTDP-4-dehydrorhamnose 3,5-epimerase
MRFGDLQIDGPKLISIQKLEDERGFFARSFCEKELEKVGIDFSIKQTNISYNRLKGTIRGMHHQISPFEEAKIVSCTSGSIEDYIIDLRVNSPTYCKWISAELDAREFNSIYIPKGFAHGFITLEADSIVSYLMNEFFHPEAACGIRWNDPTFNIDWKYFDEYTISEKDNSYPDFVK